MRDRATAGRTKHGGPSGAIRAVGLMSGTSLDGVDAAMVVTDGVTIEGFGPSAYVPYGAGARAALAASLGCWPGDEDAGAMAAVMQGHEAAIEAVLAQLEDGAAPVGLLGFHGQTLAHDPRGRGTFQLGDGAALAARFGLPVVWDFRSTDVALGGEGAPLAPFFHHACARLIGAEAPVAFLNLGGVGNLTWADPSIADPAAEGALLAFDTGPANAPINDLVARRRGLDCDRDGALAGAGRAQPALLAALLDGPYFQRLPPKSLDRNDFPDLLSRVAGLSDADAAATLTDFAVACVARGMAQMPSPPARLLVTGGGRHNPVMMAGLSRALAIPVAPVEAAGLDGDMLEAQAFAYLAVRVLRGLPTSAPGTTGVAAPVAGGTISRPDGHGSGGLRLRA